MEHLCAVFDEGLGAWLGPEAISLELKMSRSSTGVSLRDPVSNTSTQLSERPTALRTALFED